MWGDSYQHSLMAQLIADHGGLFDSWEPYAPLQTFTYHFGFQGNVALYHLLSGDEIADAVLWMGQVLNALAVLALYPLTLRVSRDIRHPNGNGWAGVVAVLVAGLLLPMPMYYVNWGRYTQLAGQAILPVAVCLSWSLLEPVASPRTAAQASSSERQAEARTGRPSVWSWQMIPCWVAVLGLAVTHYRVLVFYIVFVVVLLPLVLRRETWRITLSRALLIGLIPAALFVPWFVRTFAGRIVAIAAAQLTRTPPKMSAFDVQYNAIGHLTTYMAPVGWLLLLVAVAVGLWRRLRGVLIVFLWWGLLLMLTNPEWFRLPGSGAISNFALFISVYIPAGVLIGTLVGWMGDWLDRGTWARVALVVIVAGVGLMGAIRRTQDIRVKQHALVLAPDLRAMAWIRENTAPDARFLVNSFFAYGDRLVVGSDAGWWLPLLAGRANTVPPLNYGSEQGPWPEYRLWVNELTRQLQTSGVDDPSTVEALRERGVTHVYVGQQEGRVNYSGPHVLDPEALVDSPYYEPVYHEDRVWVFRVVPE
jgi:hypothetical protein